MEGLKTNRLVEMKEENQELLAPNGKPSNLNKEQWEKSKNAEISKILSWGSDVEGNFETKNVFSELQRICEQSSVPEHQRIAEIMSSNEDLAKKIDILVGPLSKYGGQSGLTRPASLAYDEKDGEQKLKFIGLVYISEIDEEDIIPFTQDDQDETILHELIHFYTSALIDFKEKHKETKRFSEEQIYFLDGLKSLWDTYRQNGGFFNQDEFLAYGISNARYGLGSPNEIGKIKMMILPDGRNLYEHLLELFKKYYTELDLSVFTVAFDQNGDPTPEAISAAEEHIRSRKSDEPSGAAVLT